MYFLTFYNVHKTALRAIKKLSDLKEKELGIEMEVNGTSQGAHFLVPEIYN